MNSIPQLLALVVACGLLTHLLMPAVRKLGLLMRLVDHPSWRRAHREAIPCSGGIAIYLAVALSAAILAFTVGQPFSGGAMLALLVAGAGTMVLGILDDRFGLHAEKKLLGQIVVVTLPMAAGLTLERVAIPFVGIVELGPLAGPVTLFWYLGFINSFNLIDGLDGLAGGIAVIVLGAMGWTVAGTDPVGLLFVLIFLGSVAGFLKSNLSKPRIFLGDAGSMLLGLWAAGLTLGLSVKSPLVPAVAVVAMAVPILDTATTILRRHRRGVSIFRADDEHLHHRLLRLGMAPRRAVGSLVFATIAASAIGISLAGSPSAAILALGAFAAGAVELAYTLPRTPPPSVGEALSYLLGLTNGMGEPADRQQLAEIIEMPQYARTAAPEPAAKRPVVEPKTSATAPHEALSSTAAEAGKDVILAITEDRR